MNEETKIRLRFKPETPPNISAILEEIFSENCNDEFKNEYLKKILKFRKSLENDNTPDDLGFLFSVDATSETPKEAQLELFIRYMGLTLYWHEEQKSDTAWYYYAKAQYHLGIFQSWDLVVEHLVEKDIARQAKVKAAKIKHQKTNEPIMSELAKVIVEKKPENGWASKKELINAAMPALDEIYKKLGSDSFPLYEDLERTVSRWLSTVSEAHRLYVINAAPENPDRLY